MTGSLATSLLLILAAATAPPSATAPPAMHADCPMHASHVPSAAQQAHPSHLDEVNARGEHEMGFSQQKTAHHFELTAGGGTITVTVLDSSDVESRDQVREHLRALGPRFASGDFRQPEAIHGLTPPGAEVMIELAGEITYRYEELERGGRLVLETSNSEARAAIHDFLRFQIDDHETGDPLIVGGQGATLIPRP